MTHEQRKRTEAALRCYGAKLPGNHNSPDVRRWADAIEQTMQYYSKQDPVRAGVLRLRYLEHRSEADTIESLHVGRTTYQKALADMLSTVAVYAAQRGVTM